MAEGPLRPSAAHRTAGAVGEHEHVVPAPPLQGGHRDEPAAVPETTAPAGGPPLAAGGPGRRRHGGAPGRLRKRLAVQPRVQPAVRRAAAARRGPPAGRRGAAGAGRRRLSPPPVNESAGRLVYHGYLTRIKESP